MNYMTISDKKLPFSGNAILLDKISTNYAKFVDKNAVEIPSQQTYKIACEDESPRIIRSARKAALNTVKEKDSSIKKIAFDTRRIDQEVERNPRSNLQYWNRSDAFIDEGDQYNIKVLGRLFKVLEEIKDKFGRQPEYLDSYARQMHEHVGRALRVNAGDHDYYRPQFAYIEQILFARYRLTFDEILKWSNESIQFKFLQKDEALLKRGHYLDSTNEIDSKFGDKKVNKRQSGAVPIIQRISENSEIEKEFVKNTNFANEVVTEAAPFLSKHEISTVNSEINSGKPVVGVNSTVSTQQSIINALFGDVIRKPGEKASSRTITITIKDAAEDP